MGKNATEGIKGRAQEGIRSVSDAVATATAGIKSATEGIKGRAQKGIRSVSDAVANATEEIKNATGRAQEGLEGAKQKIRNITSEEGLEAAKQRIENIASVEKDRAKGNMENITRAASDAAERVRERAGAVGELASNVSEEVVRMTQKLAEGTREKANNLVLDVQDMVWRKLAIFKKQPSPTDDGNCTSSIGKSCEALRQLAVPSSRVEG